MSDGKWFDGAVEVKPETLRAVNAGARPAVYAYEDGMGSIWIVQAPAVVAIPKEHFGAFVDALEALYTGRPGVTEGGR